MNHNRCLLKLQSKRRLQPSAEKKRKRKILLFVCEAATVTEFSDGTLAGKMCDVIMTNTAGKHVIGLSALRRDVIHCCQTTRQKAVFFFSPSVFVEHFGK